MEITEAKLLGRLHNRDKTRENLFICSCGGANWITDLNEGNRKVQCNKCNKSYNLVRNKNLYKILHQTVR